MSVNSEELMALVFAVIVSIMFFGAYWIVFFS